MPLIWGRRRGFNPWVGKIPWRRERLPTPVFLHGEFHGLYSPWGHKESDMTEWLSWASLLAHMVKHLPVMRETQVGSQGWEDPLEKEMATHSSILTWKIPWTEEPCRLQSMGSQRVGHDWATSLSFYFIFWQEGGSIGETSFPLLPGLSPPLIP